VAQSNKPVATPDPCPLAPDAAFKAGLFADLGVGKLAASLSLFAFNFPNDGSRNFMTQGAGIGLKHTPLFGIPLGVGVDRESHDGGLSWDNYSWSGTSDSVSASNRGLSFDIGLGVGVSFSHLERLFNLLISCAQ
jgi:hypothetical protein